MSALSGEEDALGGGGELRVGEQREKEDSIRITRQRPVLRVCAELALVGIIKDGPKRSGGEWMMKVIRELVGGGKSMVSKCGIAKDIIFESAFQRSNPLFPSDNPYIQANGKQCICPSHFNHSPSIPYFLHFS